MPSRSAFVLGWSARDSVVRGFLSVAGEMHLVTGVSNTLTSAYKLYLTLSPRVGD
jgi:hypothetical protein